MLVAFSASGGYFYVRPDWRLLGQNEECAVHPEPSILGGQRRRKYHYRRANIRVTAPYFGAAQSPSATETHPHWDLQLGFVVRF